MNQLLANQKKTTISNCMPWAGINFPLPLYKGTTTHRKEKKFQSPYQKTKKLQPPQRATHKSAYPILHQKLKIQIDNMLICMAYIVKFIVLLTLLK